MLQEEDDWLIYHAYDAENHGRPTLRISSLNWNTDGWPVVEAPVDIEELNNLPDDYFLYQNNPNPFNPATSIEYKIPSTENVILKVYDISGREIATLVNERKTQGNYKVIFDGSRLTSGVYMYRLQAGNYSITKKMVFLK